MSRGIVQLVLLSSWVACQKAADQPATEKATGGIASEKHLADPETPDWKAAFQHEVSYESEKSQLRVHVSIKPGYHAYTLGETIGKPMRLTVDPNGAYSVVDKVGYPKGKEKSLVGGRSVTVEGEADIVATLKKTPGQEGPIEGSFRYQVCTETACDRPRTAPFTLDAQ